MGVGELGKDTVDKGVVPTSGISRSIPKVEGGAKDKGNKSAWLEEARTKKLKGALGWGEMRVVCRRGRGSREARLWAGKSGIVHNLPGLKAT